MRCDAARIEEAALNALQTQQQLFFDGWLVRLSPGKAKRGRSVNPHFGSSLPLEAKIERCESLYASRRLPALFRITPFAKPGELDDVLARRGYVAFDRTLVQVAGIATPPMHNIDGPVAIEEVPIEAFARAAGKLRGSSSVRRTRTSSASRIRRLRLMRSSREWMDTSSAAANCPAKTASRASTIW